MMHRSVRQRLPVASLTLLILFFHPAFLVAQVNARDSLLAEVTLKNAIDYAIIHQPIIQQSLLDQELVEANIRSRLSEMYPQLNFNYLLQHNFIIQTAVIAGNNVKLGVNNTSAGQFSFSQNIFSRDVLLANRTKSTLREQGRQVTSSNKIDIAADVAKAFYDVLSTMQQLRISNENIVRIERSLKDAYNQYTAGIADKIDYKRATITLNNTNADKRSNESLLDAKLAYLKAMMGYPNSGKLNIVYDSSQVEKEIQLDTLTKPDYRLRIEYNLLETRQRLLEYNVKYNKWSYLPNISATGAYNLNFQNNGFNKLYNNNFPNSFTAVSLGFPLFQGGKRKADTRIAQLDLQRNNLEIVNLQNNINAGYAQALAMYKSNLQYYLALKENLALAREVYDVVQLQYRSGIKTYLEVITAETDLRTSQINYYTAIYQLLSSKVDVQKQLGQIIY